ncbi:hypothetical protein BKA65DRAFT_403017 [Rhexocercosporidium sp. MPI-PUGE-AT-0058]|nr:hypothetical protein BKA65DRAFT_403017 [Rhexocercosporidium sp. MPI-PUGE-AT-0058]
MNAKTAFVPSADITPAHQPTDTYALGPSTALAPLAMSQTKDDLLKHLKLPIETYMLMAKETDVVYNWLISDTGHLKPNSGRKAHYDWSDITERAKKEAMEMISQGGDQNTKLY